MQCADAVTAACAHSRGCHQHGNRSRGTLSCNVAATRPVHTAQDTAETGLTSAATHRSATPRSALRDHHTARVAPPTTHPPLPPPPPPPPPSLHDCSGINSPPRQGLRDASGRMPSATRRHRLSPCNVGRAVSCHSNITGTTARAASSSCPCWISAALSSIITPPSCPRPSSRHWCCRHRAMQRSSVPGRPCGTPHSPH